MLDHGAQLECAPDAKGRTPRSIALEHPDYPGCALVLAAL
jgi:hypothetical protein